MLVGRSMFYCWLSVGWCVGVVKEVNGDRRRKMDGEVINLFTHYEIDDDTSAHVLTLMCTVGRVPARGCSWSRSWSDAVVCSIIWLFGGCGQRGGAVLLIRDSLCLREASR